MKLSKSMKTKIKDARDTIFVDMCQVGLKDDEWDKLNKKYQVYNNMLKTNWKITPDTLLVVTGNLLGIILILHHEKVDIITSKALGFVLRGRV